MQTPPEDSVTIIRMLQSTPDFRLYHSNALDVLAGLLAETLAEPVPGQALLAPDIILIPQAAMRRWLQAILAERCGIAANLEFLTPGEFVTRALWANVPGEMDDFSAETLHWRVYAALNDAELLAQPAMRRIAAHLCDKNNIPDLVKTWGLAGELAQVFEKYQAWRRDWLLDWENGAATTDPQAMIWRNIATGQQHRARRIDTYLRQFEQSDSPLPKKLPARLFAFATLSISPDVLRVIATQARVGTLHFYLFSPTQVYWGDVQTRFEQRFGNGSAIDENPLLQAWGAAGRDFIAMLGNYEWIHPRGDISAWVEPDTGSHPGINEGGLADSLLHRLQADLFHRRAPLENARLPQLRRNDPSVQIHACHTRLRELQVLHDQLHALLDDARFDPPLQPREIAVLAPDMTLYAPYLHSVFGEANELGALPWVQADTSPLTSEPLAELFLRLIDLPNSRFGLNEMLDLLGNPLFFRFTGLDENEIERLKTSLQAAGARWGWDAAHRKEHAAPFDSAYTWQFAFDRILLGTATAAEADLVAANGEIVAPWPELEGGASESLGHLLDALRTLDAWRKQLNRSIPAQDWRELLFGMLNELYLDEAPATSSNRTLKRLRECINTFSETAQQAGFNADIPADIVRAWFTQALSEVDTRAPLLTGGISFARMLPMRLLPFRVICILGLNDGEFPHRDPAAGLNRITADLNTPHRRPGDRSTRDDDRFLFLQLLVSAQNVLYLSYLGADPRDGSVREPSVLVSELIDAAAAQHVDADTARKQLTVRHPLQPFSAAAFGGDDEPRRFSYQSQWHPAAIPATAHRNELPAWMTAPFSAPVAECNETSIPLDELRRFLSDPAGQFLRQRLHLLIPEITQSSADLEPLDDRDTLQQVRLQDAILSACINHDTEHLYQRLRARALLPSGEYGRRQCRMLHTEIRPFAEQYQQYSADGEAQSVACMVKIDGYVLGGEIQHLYPRGLLRVRPRQLNGPAAIRFGLDWLLANAAGMNVAMMIITSHPKSKLPIQQTLEPVSADHAKAALGCLLQLREHGLRAPLLFAPRTGWAIYCAENATKARTAAFATWYGSDYGGVAESNTDSIRLLFRSRDVLANPHDHAEFARTSRAIYSALLSAQIPGAEPP